MKWTMSKKGYIAFDLGAESGRAMLGVLEGGRIVMHEAHRFPNLPQHLPSGYHWNLLDLWSNLVQGLKLAANVAREQNVRIVSLGVDTWGVDCALLGRNGELLGLPYAYRDDRNPPAMKKAIAQLGEPKIYEHTGIQFMSFNTLFQLVAQRDAEPGLLDLAQRLLNIPDLLHYFFTGQMVNEATIASTTQMVDPRTGKWATELMTSLGLPTRLLGPIAPAGTVLGELLPRLAKEAGLEGQAVKVILPGSHDTASAVAAVPVSPNAGRNWAYLSSGTWSLMGAELDAPVVSEAARTAGFTNERGVGGKIRFLKNIAGLWLVQEVRRDLERRGQSLDYGTLTALAGKAEPFRTLVNPGYEPFASPGDMLAKIDGFARQTRQPLPSEPGQYVRCCLESLAMAYRATLDQLNGLLDQRLALLHIVGGGGRNELLNQLTADAVNLPVIVGPYEGTAVGNALTQAIGAGDVRDLHHLRQIVRDSFETRSYQPQNAPAFASQLNRYRGLLG
jgi:rhamnulokinase